MVRLFGVAPVFIGLLLLGVAWRTVGLGVAFDCIAQQCGDTPVPGLLSIGMGLLYGLAGLAALYVAARAFTWQGRSSQARPGGK